MKKFIETKLKKAIYAYYVEHKSIMSDKEFDAMYDVFKKIDPQNEIFTNVGSDISSTFQKRKHLMVMGSQEKFNTREGLENWLRIKKIQFPLIMQEKLDGLSIELQYFKGDFTYAVTRGNGKIGDDITDNVKKMQGVPLSLDISFTGSVRGEILLDKKTFQEKYSDKFANPRNLASGIAKGKDGKNCEDLTIICYDVQFKNNPYSVQQSALTFLSKNKFNSVSSILIRNVDEIMNQRRKIFQIKDSLNFSIDGLVLKQNKVIANDLLRLRPETQRAFKWLDIGKTSILRDVEWHRSGVTYTPIAIFDPIQIEGTTVSKASLANPNLIKELQLAINDEILITKRGQIIPKIEEVTKQAEKSIRKIIEYPKTCVLCGTLLINNGTRLYCPNESCVGKSQHRLTKWLGTLDVKGFGSALMETIYSIGIEKVSELYDKDTESKVLAKTNLQEATKKAFTNLKNKKTISLAELIGGLDIEGIGTKLVAKITEIEEFNTLEKIMSKSLNDFVGLPGFGQTRALNFYNGLKSLESELILIYNTLNIKEYCVKSEASSNTLGNYCITGKLETGTRKDLIKLIEDHGGTFVSGINKKTDYLIINDLNSTSSKAKKARELNIPMISEFELLAKF